MNKCFVHGLTFKNAGKDSIVTLGGIVLLIRVSFPESSTLGFRKAYVVLGLRTSKSIWPDEINSNLAQRVSIQTAKRECKHTLRHYSQMNTLCQAPKTRL